MSALDKVIERVIATGSIIYLNETRKARKELAAIRTRIAELEAENICLQKGMEAAEKVINLLLWVGLEDGVEKGEKWLAKYGKEQK